MVSISAITSGVKSIYRYGKRFLNTTPELVFGTGANAAGKAMRGANGSLFDKAGAGWRALEQNGKGSFFKNFVNNFKTFIPDVKNYVKAGHRLASIKGTSKIAGSFKGLMKGLGKKLPFIGSVMLVAFELPNIFKAVKEKGLFAGIKETFKSGARLIGAGLGSAVGSAICPGLGSLIGWVAGEWLVGKIVGKSYSEQQAEQEENNAQLYESQMAELAQQQAPNTQIDTNNYNPITQNQVNPYAINPYNYNSKFNDPYANDIYMKQLPFNVVA